MKKRGPRGELSGAPLLPADLGAIIYDCDGVLFDTTRANEAFYNHILAHFGLPALGPEKLPEIQVMTAEEIIDQLFQGTSLVAKAQTYQKGLGNERFIPLATVEPFLRETLRRLRPRYHTAVASNRGKSLRPLLDGHGLLDCFDLLVGSLDVRQSKPDPECLWKVIDFFGIPASRVVYIGDSEIDRLTSDRAGVWFAAYKNPALETPWHLQGHPDIFLMLGPGIGVRPAREGSKDDR